MRFIIWIEIRKEMGESYLPLHIMFNIVKPIHDGTKIKILIKNSLYIRVFVFIKI